MERKTGSRLRIPFALLVLVGVSVVLAGCAGTSSGNQVVNNPNPDGGTLSVSPSTLNFGSVAVGNTSSLTATLSATNTAVTISSADWSGSGYSVSGITFPATVTPGTATKYTVTFTPATAGSSPGSISFSSNATNATLQQNFTGAGSQTGQQHSVALNWDPSTSTVAGYNLYRGTQPGGPYLTRLNSSLLSDTAFTDSSVQSGATYYYVSTAVDSSNLESNYSNEASAVIP